jgi:hypothetical protein
MFRRMLFIATFVIGLPSLAQAQFSIGFGGGGIGIGLGGGYAPQYYAPVYERRYILVPRSHVYPRAVHHRRAVYRTWHGKRYATQRRYYSRAHHRWLVARHYPTRVVRTNRDRVAGVQGYAPAPRVYAPGGYAASPRVYAPAASPRVYAPAASGFAAPRVVQQAPPVAPRTPVALGATGGTGQTFFNRQDAPVAGLGARSGGGQSGFGYPGRGARSGAGQSFFNRR